MFEDLPAEDSRIIISQSDEYRQMLFDSLDLAIRTDAQFLIFPEYCWPQAWIRDAVDLLREKAHVGMLAILPVEHMTLAEYIDLLRALGVTDAMVAAEEQDARAAAPTHDDEDVIVNAALLVLSGDDGTLHVIPQRKLRPAGLEETALAARFRFAEGTIVRIVAGASATIAVLICFDYIAQDERYGVEPRELLREAELTHLFVPECNPSPLHSFYTSAAFESTGGTELPPVQIFCNVAADAVLPPLERAQFGFSRIIGDLGSVSPSRSDSVVVFEGLLADQKVRSFEQLQQTERTISSRVVRSVYLRPEQTAANILLPPSGSRTSGDPRRGRTNTELQLFRYYGPPASWRAIRSTPKYSRPVLHEVPKDYLVGWELFGAEEHVARFRELLYRHNEPIWITGEGGVGKTAIAARVIAAEAVGNRVIWIDLGQLEHDEGALREALLLSLGGGEALAQQRNRQVEEILVRVRSQVTVIVLDSFERWPQDFPEWLPRIGGWKSRLVITARDRPASRASDPFVFVDRPSLENAARLVRTIAGIPADARSGEILARLTGRLPVGCVWAGQFAKQSPATAELLADELQRENEPLTPLFRALLRDLAPVARKILGILCELPAPVLMRDLRDIAESPQTVVAAAIRTLRERGLLMNLPSAGTRASGLHFRHPFVKEFWRASASPGERREIEEQLLAWCRQAVKTWGGDRNWAGLPELDTRWQNIGFLIRERVAKDADEQRMRLFLELWEGVDTFLWSTRRWRERMELGRTAVSFANALHEPLAKARALYESLAQPEWHLHSNREAAEPLIDEAVGIFRSMDPTPVHLVRAEWYRSRMLLRCRFAEEALVAARYALELAATLPARDGDERDRRHATGLALHGLGNALMELQQFDEAMAAYEQARTCFDETRDREMAAVVARRMGALHLQRGELGAAALALERSMEELRQMRIPLEEAETALFLARLLKEIGDARDARRYLAYAESVLGGLGSVVRNRELDDTKRAVEHSDETPPA